MKQSPDELWKDAVEAWLNHLPNNQIENACLMAMENASVESAVNLLSKMGYQHIFGRIGINANTVAIDVSTVFEDPNFIRVYERDWAKYIMSISMRDILVWLKNGKKTIAVQLQLEKSEEK